MVLVVVVMAVVTMMLMATAAAAAAAAAYQRHGWRDGQALVNGLDALLHLETLSEDWATIAKRAPSERRWRVSTHA